jgi:ABC-type branched-subunit amino acid transport system substrate-binding protein
MALNTSGQIPYHQAVLKLAGSRGWNVVSDQSITYGASDLTVEIGKVVAAHPDILITSLDDNSVILLMHGLKAAGISVPVIDTTALGSLSTFAQLADPNLYAMSAVAWDVPSNTTAGMKKLIAGASAAGVQPTLQYFNHGWLDGLMVGAALSACGFPCSGAQAQKALDKLNLDTQGVTPGPVTFSTSDHQGLHAASVYHWDATSASVTAVKENLPTGSV